MYIYIWISRKHLVQQAGKISVVAHKDMLFERTPIRMDVIVIIQNKEKNTKHKILVNYCNCDDLWKMTCSLLVCVSSSLFLFSLSPASSVCSPPKGGENKASKSRRCGSRRPF